MHTACVIASCNNYCRVHVDSMSVKVCCLSCELVLQLTIGMTTQGVWLHVRTLCILSTGLHSTTTECVGEPAPKKSKSSPIDVSRLKARYLRLQSTAKTDWPKHKVTQYIKLALIKKEDITLRDENLNEVTKLTLQGDVDRILKKKEPLGDLREIFYYEDKPCPRLIVIMGGPGEY